MPYCPNTRTTIIMRQLDVGKKVICRACLSNFHYIWIKSLGGHRHPASDI